MRAAFLVNRWSRRKRLNPAISVIVLLSGLLPIVYTQWGRISLGFQTSHDTEQSNIYSAANRYLQYANWSCPPANGSSTLLSSLGPVLIRKSSPGTLCTLTVASYNKTSLTAILPLARTYDGFDWERAAGEFATDFYRNQSWSCDSTNCQIILPSLPNNMTYRLASYSYSMTQRDEIARLLETATFGVSKSDIENFSIFTDFGNNTGDLQTRMARWIWIQMNASKVGMTSHREFWRARANTRVAGPFRVGVPHHPCKAQSRWRTFAFSELDTVDQKRALLLGYKLNDKWVLTVDGKPRTITASFNLQANTNYTFCSNPPIPNKESVNGLMYVRLNAEVLRNCLAVNNSLVNMTGYESLLGLTVLSLPSRSSGFVSVDQDDLSGDEFLLKADLTDTKCTSTIPKVIDFTTPPIFGKHSDGSWLLYDPHLKLLSNTPKNPVADGGRTNLLDSFEKTACLNVRRNFLNENLCTVPTNVSVCRPLYQPESGFTLDEVNIRQIYNLTGRYVYAMLGLPVVDQYGNKLPHPCTPNLRSRWVLSDDLNCTPTSVQEQTSIAISWLLKNSLDSNSFLREITFPKSGLSCDKNDVEPQMVLNINGTCYSRVHPDYLSVFDMTYWTLNNTHPGNSIATNSGHRNPIKKWAEDGSAYLIYPAVHPLNPNLDHDLNRWNIFLKNFTYIGRFGDHVLIDSLPSNLQGQNLLSFFGSRIDPATSNNSLLCGSPGEVENNETLGDMFQVFTPERTVNSKTIIETNAEVVWTMIALQATDQLRQRVAWAFSQLLVIIRDAILNDNLKTEWFVNYYDIFVRNAFGNYRDILKEISYSSLMAESLTYLNSKSAAYMLETYQLVTSADENYAREAMQLFTIGVTKLNFDGTPAIDSNGSKILNYNNDDITSFARAWTGFTRDTSRSGIEDNGGNRIDPMRINPQWRDRFVKTNLQNGYIGDGYPLCEDFLPQMFLRKGAQYNYLGDSNIPELSTDPLHFWTDPSIKKFELSQDSALRVMLCNPDELGICRFSPTVVLDSTLPCAGKECHVETIRVVQVDNIFYEYVPLPCVRYAFFNNAMKLTRSINTEPITCANPYLLDASVACCESGSSVAERSVLYDGERSSYSAAQKRCSAGNQTLCNMKFVNTSQPFKFSSYHWTSETCRLMVKINPSGFIAIVYEPSTYTVVDALVNVASENFFKVHWNEGYFPSIESNCSSVCSIYLDNCVCDIFIESTQVFHSMPYSKAEILQSLHTGSLDPEVYNKSAFIRDVNFTSGITAYLNSSGEIDSSTVFTFVDHKQKKHILKNLAQTVQLIGTDGSSTVYSFRNPPHFVSLVPTESSVGACSSETDATIDEYFYHDNVAPYIAHRLIQRLISSNPSPRYVTAVADAFRTGLYEQNGYSYGYGKYGDLSATIACIYLDREARNTLVDVDASNGMLREPLLKVVALMRSGSFIGSPKTPFVRLFDLLRIIGQSSHRFTSVFSFFVPDFKPSHSRISSAHLVSPESAQLSVPKIIGILNGMVSLITSGLTASNGGFGWPGESISPTGYLSFNTSLNSLPNMTSIVNELATLWTAGRLSQSTRKLIISAVDNYKVSTSLKSQLAQILVISSAEFHSTSLVRSTTSYRSSFSFSSLKSSNYKAVIYVMFSGGCDSFNVLVPYSCTEGIDLVSQYVSIRQQVALPKSRLLPITVQNQVCETFGIHESLPTVYNLYKQGDLAFIANTGVMDTYVNKSNYQALTTTQLYDHIAMRYAVQRMDPSGKRRNTGVIGRISDKIRSYGLNTGSFYIDRYSIALAGSQIDPLGVSNNGFLSLNATSTVKSSILSVHKNQSQADSGFFSDLWSDTISQSIRMADSLSAIMSNVTLMASFPNDSAIGSQFATVARLIKSRVQRGSNFDSFYIEMGGFDTHSDLDTVLANLLNQFDIALSSFVAEVEAMGLWNQVVTVQVSDFGRTLNANGNDGTDHGWGGNYMILGGPVKGGKVLGKYPYNLSEKGNLNLGRGRILPTTSWDSVFSSIASWVGVHDLDLLDVCPNLNLFPSSKQITPDDLFDGFSPTSRPSRKPSKKPTKRPTSKPKPFAPTKAPISKPTKRPSRKPSRRPSKFVSKKPSKRPSARPSRNPTARPSSRPSKFVSKIPSNRPTARPSRKPTARPSSMRSQRPTTTRPSRKPTAHASAFPSNRPTAHPTKTPTRKPSSHPSEKPSIRLTANEFTKLPSQTQSIMTSSKPSNKLSTKPTDPLTSAPVV